MIEVKNLRVEAGLFTLEDISFVVPEGVYGVLMGRTGCGKTTLLEALCGLKKISGGTIRLCGQDVTHARAGDRGIGFVPQDVALFHHLTVAGHLAFGPRIHGWPEAKIRTRVTELAEELNITSLLDRRPQGLSGGERQRVALGRALATEPRILCLDEPLSALDDATREDICALIQRIHRDHRITALHITHSQNEAKRLGQTIFRFENGTLQQS